VVVGVLIGFFALNWRTNSNCDGNDSKDVNKNDRAALFSVFYY